MRVNLARLSKRLDYEFKNVAYLKQALSHCSVGTENYERYEFLGDSILSFVIADELFHRFPMHTEGQLSRLRAFLVNGDMLADLAKELDLGEFLILGQGELKSGGFRRTSILADALEALFAAVFFDGGLDAAQKVILDLYHSRLEDPHLNDCLKDAKTQLQEYLQAGKYALPKYKLNQISGDEHDQIFHVSCSVDGIPFATKGHGASRRKAEQSAASAMLQKLQKL